MDALDTARRMAQHVSDGGDVDAFVKPEALPVAQLMVTRPEQATRLEVLDAMWKRNLVFLSYAWRDASGKDAASGTWILSFGRDGLITHWTAME